MTWVAHGSAGTLNQDCAYFKYAYYLPSSMHTSIRIPLPKALPHPETALHLLPCPPKPYASFKTQHKCHLFCGPSSGPLGRKELLCLLYFHGLFLRFFFFFLAYLLLFCVSYTHKCLLYLLVMCLKSAFFYLIKTIHYIS